MPTNPNMVAIQTVTVGSGGAASIQFTSIPQTYTDLKIVASARSTASGYDFHLNAYFNGNTSNYSQRAVYGTGSNAYSYSATIAGYAASLMGTSGTANTFGNAEIYIPNYTGSTNKSYSVDNVTELNSATNNRADLLAGLWSNTSAITSITMTTDDGTSFAQYSTFTLYGVTSAGYGAKATGGIITSDANYYYHTFLASGTFTPTSSITADILVVAGGGSGASGGNSGGAGGGGAGGFLAFSAQSLSATGYTITVGAGGAAVSTTGGSAVNGNTGNDSQFGALTLVKGGGYGGGGLLDGVGTNGGNGGSGGGAGRWSNSASFYGGNPTSSQGFRGGNALSTGAGGRCAGGGGGAGAQGTDTTDVGTANGGNGLNTYSSWASATNTGVSGYYAGGGGGSAIGQGPTVGGSGGGGGAPIPNGSAQTADSGLANTGGGGGGMGGGDAAVLKASGSGGSGIVIVRYAK